MRVALTVLPLILTFVGCMDTVKVAPHVVDLGTLDNIDQLELGRKLYVTRCTKCHNALRITRFSQEEWSETLPVMIRKSKFTPQQTLDVTAYIQAVLHSASSTN
jgi:hypothetical protein